MPKKQKGEKGITKCVIWKLDFLRGSRRSTHHNCWWRSMVFEEESIIEHLRANDLLNQIDAKKTKRRKRNYYVHYLETGTFGWFSSEYVFITACLVEEKGKVKKNDFHQHMWWGRNLESPKKINHEWEYLPR